MNYKRYKENETANITDKEREILKELILLYGAASFAVKIGMNYHTMLKKLNQDKMPNGNTFPIYQEDVEKWYWGITNKKWCWNKKRACVKTLKEKIKWLKN